MPAATHILHPHLSRAALAVRSMQPKAAPVPAVFIAAQDAATIAALRARIADLEQQLAARAQREERLKAVTIRVVDRIAAWEAKQPRPRRPHITLTPGHIITADVWTTTPAA